MDLHLDVGHLMLCDIEILAKTPKFYQSHSGVQDTQVHAHYLRTLNGYLNYKIGDFKSITIRYVYNKQCRTIHVMKTQTSFDTSAVLSCDTTLISCTDE